MTPERRAIEVLVAEDSPTQAEMLEALLRANDFAVTVAGNGREALEAARRRAPAVVVSDVVMPELDGYGLCRALRDDPNLRDVPVILLTSLSDPEDVLRGLQCGADNFLRKPYDERYLLARIDYLLMNRELRRNQRTQLGIQIMLGGQEYFITAERQQILDLLISTYEQAVQINNQLKLREQELARSHEDLQQLVREKSEELEARARTERLLDDLTNSVPGALFRLRFQGDGSSRFEFLSRGVEALRGVSREAALQDPNVIWRTVLEDDLPVLNRAG